MPWHHNLEEHLTAYLDGARLRSDGRCSARGRLTPAIASAGERLSDEPPARGAGPEPEPMLGKYSFPVTGRRGDVSLGFERSAASQ
jgi:hypothetical protein